MSRFILGGELVWLGTGTASGALTARRRGALEWRMSGLYSDRSHLWRWWRHAAELLSLQPSDLFIKGDRR
jgi:hypothetical protein